MGYTTFPEKHMHVSRINSSYYQVSAHWVLDTVLGALHSSSAVSGLSPSPVSRWGSDLCSRVHSGQRAALGFDVGWHQPPCDRQQEAHLGSVWGESGISLATEFQASQKSLLKNSSRFIAPLRYNSMCHITPIYIMCEIESPISYIIYCIIAVLVNF